MFALEFFQQFPLHDDQYIDSGPLEQTILAQHPQRLKEISQSPVDVRTQASSPYDWRRGVLVIEDSLLRGVEAQVC